MGQRSDTIVKRFRSFSDEVITFVENLSDMEFIIFENAAQHFDSMKAAVAG